jgi:hypothetical protein
MLKNTEKDCKKKDIKGIIYKVTSPSGKVYIGKTTNSLEYRKGQHVRAAFNKNSDTYHTKICRAIRRYGNLLTWEVLRDNIGGDELSREEVLAIKEFNSVEEGYNISPGGDGGNIYDKLTEKQKKIFSKKSTKNLKKWWNTATEEQKQQRTKGLKLGTLAAQNREITEEENARRSAAVKKSWSNQKLLEEASLRSSGKNNPMSTESIMKRHNCSKEEAFNILSDIKKRAWQTRRLKSKK